MVVLNTSNARLDPLLDHLLGRKPNLYRRMAFDMQVKSVQLKALHQIRPITIAVIHFICEASIDMAVRVMAKIKPSKGPFSALQGLSRQHPFLPTVPSIRSLALQ